MNNEWLLLFVIKIRTEEKKKNIIVCEQIQYYIQIQNQMKNKK